MSRNSWGIAKQIPKALIISRHRGRIVRRRAGEETMAIDDRLEKALDFYSKELETDLPKKALAITIEQIPHLGSQINKLLFGDAQRRVAERAQDVFAAVKDRLERIDKAKLDKEFLKSDEFMTVLLLAIEQLQTTHDQEKKRMLANALANSSLLEFSSDSRKELFMRIFRDLAPEHIQMLQVMRRKAVTRSHEHGPMARDIKDPHGKDLAILQSLAADGLVDEYLEKKRPSIPTATYSSQREITKTLEDLLLELPKRCFRMSEFGEDFLKYFDSLEASVPNQSGSSTKA
jgi:hypothetical protein